MDPTRSSWRFDVDGFCLVGPHGYEVDLDRCTTSAEVLDWICQVAKKSWGSPEVVGELVQALDDILHPQETLCTDGRERGPVNPRNTAADTAGLDRHRLGLRPFPGESI